MPKHVRRNGGALGTVIYHDESGRPYTARNGVSAWLPEPVYLDGAGNPYTERSGSRVWLEPDRRAFLLAPSAHARWRADGVLSVSYDRSFDDNLQMLEYHYRRGPARRALGSYGLLLCLTAAMGILIAVLAAIDGVVVISAFFAGVALIFALFGLRFLLMPRTQPRRILREHTANPYYRASSLGTKTVTLTPSGIAADSSLYQRMVGWPLVSDVLVEADGLYVYTADELAVSVPARAFESREGFEQFAATAARYVDQFKLTTARAGQPDGSA